MPTIERDGLHVHYTRVGEGPAVLLVQGVGVIGAGWNPQVESLSQRYRVARP